MGFSLKQRGLVAKESSFQETIFKTFLFGCKLMNKQIFYQINIFRVWGVVWNTCGDLGINSKNSQPDIDSSAARYKMYKRVATHKAPRIHPVKNQKKEK